MGGRAKDTRARRGAGIATKGAATETLALGLQGRGTEEITPSGRNGARKSIQFSVIGRRESDEILKVNGSDRNQERLREVAFTIVPIAHGEVTSSTVLGGRQRERFREWGLVQEGAG